MYVSYVYACICMYMYVCKYMYVLYVYACIVYVSTNRSFRYTYIYMQYIDKHAIYTYTYSTYIYIKIHAYTCNTYIYMQSMRIHTIHTYTYLMNNTCILYIHIHANTTLVRTCKHLYNTLKIYMQIRTNTRNMNIKKAILTFLILS